MNKLFNKAQVKLHQQLINSITNEKRHFNMMAWSIDNQHDDTAGGSKPITCGTASCMYGHLVAIKPKLARQFRAEGITHVEDLAPRIYEAVTGRSIPLNAYAFGMNRMQACEHIRGNSKKFPLTCAPDQEVSED